MKHLFFTSICFVFLSFQGFSQERLEGKSAQRYVKESSALRLNAHSKRPDFIEFQKDMEPKSSSFKSWYSANLAQSSKESVRTITKEVDEIGIEHEKFQVYYSEYPIEGSVVILHSKSGKINSFNGHLTNVKVVDCTIEINEEIALKSALEFMAATEYKWQNKEEEKLLKQISGDQNATYFPKSEMVIVPEKGNYETGTFRLAFKFDIYAIKPLKREYLYVDAITGKVIHQQNRIIDIDQAGTATTKYSGVQNIMTSISGSNYVLREIGRGGGIETYNLRNQTSRTAFSDFLDLDNNWNNVNAAKDEYATDAHWGTEMTYDYYLNRHSRNSFDNRGAKMISYVHYSSGYNNAFWDGSVMTYGDGDGSIFTPLMSLDVCGHEVTHGVTERTAGLIYSNESGALNESFSDIFGTLIEFYAKPGSANFICGEDITPSRLGIRNLANPNLHGDPDTYKGTNWYAGSGDNGGVHTNSGVQNFWFYLLAMGGSGTNDLGNAYNVLGIGMLKTSQIIYRNLTVYLTPNSNYNDARFYSIQAATDLFGACSPEVSAVAQAWYAVGVGSLPNTRVTASFNSNKTYSCTTPAIFTFTNGSTNASTYLWSFGDGSTSTVASPIKTYSSPGVYTVKLKVTGAASCSSAPDSLIRTNFITVTNTGAPRTAICTPTTSGTCCWGGILNFNFGTINNSSANGSEGYKDFTCTNSTTVIEGKPYAITINTSTGNYENVRVWIDYNDDGNFSTSELVFSSNVKLGLHSGNIIIAGGAVKNKSLRLRVGSDLSSYTPSSCINSIYGQFEDYAISILPNTSPPVADFKADNQVSSIGTPINFTDLSSNIPSSWKWVFPDATPNTSTLQNPTVTYSTLGTYPVKLVVRNSYGADSLVKTSYITITNFVNLCTVSSSSALTGKIYDSGGSSGNYKNSEFCSFLINPGCASAVKLTFNTFNTESGYDYLRVYNGTTTSAPLLLSATGSVTPTSITATTGKMLVVFSSDGSGEGTGFDADWTSTIPGIAPIANFADPGIVLPLNFPVTFTDNSLNGVIKWKWSFGDGTISTSKNPTKTYVSSGIFVVKLVVDNCYTLDSISRTITVSGSSSISVNPTQLDVLLSSGDSTIRNLNVSNSGTGILAYILSGSVGKNYDSTNVANYYSTAAITTHQFNSIGNFSDTISMTVTLNGDFDYSSEYATLNIEGKTIEQIVDNDVTNGTDIVKNYKFFGPDVATWLSDGRLTVTLVNSAEVNTGIGGFDRHTVRVQTKGNTWINFSTVSTTLGGSSSRTVPVKFNAKGLNGGVYSTNITISHNDATKAPIVVPCNLTVAGVPKANFSANNIVSIGQPVYFTDLSTNTPNVWNWTFTGGTPVSSSIKNPVVTYGSPGIYPVKLVVINAFGADSATKLAYVNVSNFLATMCGTTLSTPQSNGRLFDSGGPSGFYNNNQYCTYTLAPSCPNSRITLNFNSFDTELGYDYLYVYAGTTTSGPLLGYYSGSTVPLPITSTVGGMVLLFYSNGSITRSGFDINWTTTILGTSPLANFTTNGTSFPLNSDIAFSDVSANSPTGWKWSFGDGSSSTLQNPKKQYAVPGTYQVKLVARNCLGADSTVRSVTILQGPSVVIDPLSFNVTLNSGDSTTRNLTVTNNGLGPLVFNVTGSSSSGSGKIEVLALTYGVDLTGEYVNTKSAINQYFTNYNLAEINTTNAVALQTALVGKQVLLIPEIESGSASVFTSLASVIQSFAANGGSVVFCGSSDANVLFNTGLFSGTGGTNISSTLSTTPTTHPVTTGVPTSFTYSNATFGYMITNPDKVRLVTSGSYDVVACRNVGSGKAIVVGFDYFSYDNHAARLIANAISWAGAGGAPWLSLSTSSGLVPAGSTLNITVKFNAKNLQGGLYTSILKFTTNDASKLTVNVPCSLTVAAKPNVQFTASKTSLTIGETIAYTDQTLNTPTSWKWTFEGGSPSTSTAQNPSVTYSSIGTYQTKLFAQNSYGQDSLAKTAYITVANVFNMCSSAGSNLASGRLYDSGGPTGNYTNNQNCSFLIKPACSNGTIRLSFASFGLESCCDYVTVYAGTTTSAPILLSANGTSIPATVTSTVGSMLVTFTSDGSVVSTGFDATWTTSVAGIKPVANFTAPGSIIPLNFPVSFTDNSTNGTNKWKWSFGDGTSSAIQNPFKTYSTPGIYIVKLVVDNCFALDSLSKNITVSGVSAINVTPLQLDVLLSSGDSTLRNLTVSNTATGVLSYQLSGSVGKNYDSTSVVNYLITQATTSHQFNGIGTISDTLKVTVTLNGDYDSSTEYSTLVIEGKTIEQIVDFDVSNGIDITKTYQLTGPDVATWLSDGRLTVTLVNSAEVNTGIGGFDRHTVRVQTKGNTWINFSTVSTTLGGSSSRTGTCKIQCQGTERRGLFHKYNHFP